MNTKTINREASDKTKGFRLQKLRAVRLMLETIENQNTSIFYTAIEDVEDISQTNISADKVDKYYEEDKNYHPDKNFTIFSPQVKNTLVSFFDVYVNSWKSSDEVRLGFYTTASIGKEKKNFLIDNKEIKAPEVAILETLSCSGELSDELVGMIKQVVLEEYRVQYESKDFQGNLLTLEEMDVSKFRDFISKVIWFFGEENDVKLKETILELIKKSKFHSARHEDKEEIIFCLLMEVLDERQSQTSLAKKVVFSPEVELIFKKAESEEVDLATDPTWMELQKIEKEITDKRNLKEKIISVCPDYADKKIQHLARLACRSKLEQESHNKNFLSLKYRTYEACSDYFFENKNKISSEKDIDDALKSLKSASKKSIEELKKEYKYTVANSHAVDGIVMDLFDGCFIAFDEDVK